jgi:hypothetical protein
VIENENQFGQELGNQVERFVVREIKPFDDVLDLCKDS